MTNVESSSRCPGCGANIPLEAPQGLCPACLLAGVAQPTEQMATVRVTEEAPPLATVQAAFPQLEIIECVGHGGMGVVYQARQTKLERLVALKLLPRGLAADVAFRERFTREGRVLARLNHPNIVAVYDFGEAGGMFYLLMEYVDGANLRQAMRAGGFTPAQALEIVPHICEALQYAHGEGVLHRDIKPENILLDTKGRVKIADFGIAKLMGERAVGGTLTATGAAVGTPQYMAPEQIEHPHDVDHRADIYSLGVVFYEMLTGELPLGRFAPPSAKTPVDARVDDVVFRALEKEREKRFQSAGAVKTEIEGITSTCGKVASGRSGAEVGPGPVEGEVQSRDTAGKPASDEGVSPNATAANLAEANAPATPLRIAPEHRPLVLIGLAVVLALLVPRLLPLPGLLIGTLAGAFSAGIGRAVWTGLSIAVGGGVIWMAWTNRRRLLEPLGIAAAEFEGADTVPPWARERILGTVAVAVLMALAAEVGSQVTLLVSALLGFALHLTWSALFALMLGGGLTWWLLRAERRLKPCQPLPPRPWQRRVGWWFLVLGGVGLAPTLIAHEPSLRYWQLDALLAVTGVALLTRSRAWRTAALATDAFLVVLGTAQILAAMLLAVQPGRLAEFVPVTPPLGPGMAPLLAVAQVLAFVAGLAVLCRREVRLSFGLAEAPVPLPARTPADTRPGRLSRRAVWALALVGISLLVAVSGLVLVVFLMRIVGGGGGGPSILALTLGSGAALLAAGFAIAGTVLGIASWREIGRGGERVRGKVLAVIAALTWPVLLALLLPLALLSVGLFTLRSERSAVASPVVQTGVGAADLEGGRPSVVWSYNVPAGQAAVFEVVTKGVSSVAAPLPGFAAYALAPAGARTDAVVRLEAGPPSEGPGGEGRWHFELTHGGNNAMVSGLLLPDGTADSIQPGLTRVLLEPGGEIINWFVPAGGGRTALGIRARTCAHGLRGIEPGGPRSCGLGTNWLENARLEGG